MPVQPHADYLHQTLQFLTAIGIPYQLTSASVTSFLPGVKIVNGGLLINPAQIISAGDLLHEAGHLACLPPSHRSLANDNIADSVGEAHTYEMGVILWSVLAADHLQLPLREVFHDQGYKDEASWLLQEFTEGNYIGLPLLQWMGIVAHGTSITEHGAMPTVLRWLRA